MTNLPPKLCYFRLQVDPQTIILFVKKNCSYIISILQIREHKAVICLLEYCRRLNIIDLIHCCEQSEAATLILTELLFTQWPREHWAVYTAVPNLISFQLAMDVLISHESFLPANFRILSRFAWIFLRMFE